LSEKTKGAQSEQAVLMKAFKYFDLNDNGTVEPDEFAKAIEKIGIQIPTKQVSTTFKISNMRIFCDAPYLVHLATRIFLLINYINLLIKFG
jgi:hypothetical protein